MTVYPLKEGSYSVDASKTFIPFDPEKHKAEERPASIFIHVQPFLVKTQNNLILFDAGLGQQNETGAFVLHKNIRDAGYNPADVTLVLMSHLHNDHSAGLVIKEGDGFKPSFPNAVHVVQKGESEFALSGKSGSYNKAIFDTLKDAVKWDLVEGDGEYQPGIRYQLTGAHCPFHQVYWLHDKEEIVFFGGDVLPEAGQAVRKFAAKYDYDGRKAMKLREEYVEQADKEDWLCLFYHDKSRPTGRIKITDTGVKVT